MQYFIGLKVAHPVWGAWSELDFALKLRLGGFHCRFIPTTRKDPTPDLQATRGEVDLIVDVTTMDPRPSQGLAFAAMHAMQWSAFQKKCSARGRINRIPSVKDIDDIEHTVNEACEEANKIQGLVRFDIPELMTCFIAPWDHESEIPEEWRHVITAKGSRKLSIVERSSKLIAKKSKHQLTNARVDWWQFMTSFTLWMPTVPWKERPSLRRIERLGTSSQPFPMS